MSLKGHEKAAIFLSSLSEDTAADVLKGLDVKDIGKITMHMTRLKTVTKTTMESVLQEATESMTRGDVRMGGENFVKKVLSKGLGEDGANKMLELASKEGPLESLRWVDAKTLVNFLVTEHPQTIALIICLLDPAQAAEVMQALPDNIKVDVAMRIATTERIPENAIEDLKEVLKGQLDMGKNKGKKLGGSRTVAEILNQCDRATEQAVIGKIEEQNNVLADSIRKLMFVFDDLAKVDDRGIQMILKEASTEELTLALKTTSEALKEKIFKNMSQRAAGILKEDMQTRGPVKVSDVDKAQQNIVKIARKLEAEGKLMLAGRGGEELVV
ncbi:MAG: flagellar motor switch protein FliG [Nitrospirae bacterium]|nr:flagellar motor switch protein FliG [Nitrospirota bacterium]NTW65147.1 flagellar motor switch protein FliG [Nitrospirota bacterium]